jgi:trehalose 6-phosphate phosphatase
LKTRVSRWRFITGTLIKAYFNYVVGPYVMAGKLELLKGKMVYEVRPHLDWNKGNAVMWLLEKYKNEIDKELVPVYIGDDITDESVFKCLENSGITVHVGEHKKTSAKHFVKDTNDVYEVLKEIKKVLCNE